MKLISSLSLALLMALPRSRAFSPHRQIPSSSSLSTALCMTATGPKSEGRRVRRRTPRSDSSSGNEDGPRPAQQRRQPRQRPQESSSAAFDGKAMTSLQVSNQDAPPFDLESALLSKSSIRCMAAPDTKFENEVIHPAFRYLSLDDLFGPNLGFSQKFNSDQQFRNDLRAAIRQDVFDATPFYANLSEKIAKIILLPDSSLEGSWRTPDDSMDPRMKQTTQVLQQAFGGDANNKAPSGDELFEAIGKLCGPKPSTHWIDIYGVQDRKINHSWHLDFGKSPESSTHTVLWGFPPEDHYQGCGVFSHLIPLQKECLAPDDHPRMEPVLFDGTVDEQYIVRPTYEAGKELIMYRDIDVLHSAPDVTYRTSVMRFM